MTKNLTIGFAGLTHLGIVSAAASISKGFDVIGYHKSKVLTDNLSNNILPVSEPGLDKTLENFKEKIEFTDDPSKLIQCDIIYISVDVPTLTDGTSDLTQVQDIIYDIDKYIIEQKVIVILCQVPPGFTRKLKLNSNEIYYQVETLVFGNAVERACFPERIIVGSKNSNLKINQKLDFYLSKFDCPIIKMNYESAELAKISINMYLVSMVTVTNILSEICEKIDADWEDIKPALKLDKRLGKYAYLSSGLGISGGNLERDLKTISKIGISTNSNVKVIDEFINHSRYRKSWLINILNKVINDFDNPSICVLGLTYKEKTHSVKNSPSIQILENFNKFRINTHDPEAIIKLPKNIYRKKTIKEAIKGSNILLVCTPWQQYFHLSIDEIKRLMSGNIIIDPYRVFDGKLARQKGFLWYSLGQKFK